MKKNNKIVQNESTAVDELKTLLIIILVIVLITAGLYFITEAVMNKKEANSIVDVDIDYSEITIGTMFSMPKEEYYVLMYEYDNGTAKQYNDLYSIYSEKEEAKTIYKINLGLQFNKFALGDKFNPSPKEAADVSVKEAGLFLIEKGKVIKHYETIQDMKTALK